MRLKFDDESLFPVQAFFNAISDDCFLKVISSLIERVSYSINDCHCDFPNDLDDDEEFFSGVRFSLYEDIIIISSKELSKYINIACKSFLEKHPEQELKIKKLLVRN